MKRIAASLLACVFVLTVCSCGKVDHDSLVSEIGEQNREKAEMRNTFIESSERNDALKYLKETLEELLPGCETEISIEPGSLLGEDLGRYSDLYENPPALREFFKAADASFTVNFADFDVDPAKLAVSIAQRGISGRMMTGNGGDCYELDGEAGEAEFVPAPGV